MNIKAIISITATHPDMYGNTYRRATITNTRTGRKTPGFKCSSAGNVQSLTAALLGLDYCRGLDTNEHDTGSARLSSLPAGEYYRPADLARELRKTGFQIPAARLATCRGCL